MIELSPQQARKAVLLGQGLHKNKLLGAGVGATLQAIEKLGYIQIDTISVIERAHHHTLWSRANGYQHSHLDQLVADKKVFEYWSHAAAYLPMRDYRFSLPRKHALANGEKHFHVNDPKVNKLVLERVTLDGPLQARDFAHTKAKGAAGWWEWKPAKVALEQLFMQGDLMICERRGFQKVYDLTERVLPSEVATSMPSAEEFQRHLITNYLSANGIGTAAEIAYLRKGLRADIERQCQAMLSASELLEVAVAGQNYYALPGLTERLSVALSRSKVRILSPFDNLLIQRKRTLQLFGFDYQIECYVPAAKRKYGYFTLPIIWGQSFAGRVDAKIDRKSGALYLQNLHVETTSIEAFTKALIPALKEFMSFNQGRTMQVKKISSPTLSATQHQWIEKQLSAACS